MKILKHGNPERLKKIVIFTCKHCGCVFEADKTEYKYSSFRNNESYQIECPECGNTVYDGKEKEYEENPNDNFCPIYGTPPTTITNTELKQLDGKFLDAWHEGVMTALHEHIPDSMIKKLDESYKKSEN